MLERCVRYQRTQDVSLSRFAVNIIRQRTGYATSIQQHSQSTDQETSTSADPPIRKTAVSERAHYQADRERRQREHKAKRVAEAQLPRSDGPQDALSVLSTRGGGGVRPVYRQHVPQRQESSGFSIRPNIVPSNIPFEGLQKSYPERLRGSGKASTITRSEAAVFKRLQNMIEPVRPAPDDEPVAEMPPIAPLSQLDALLDRLKLQQRMTRSQPAITPQESKQERRSPAGFLKDLAAKEEQWRQNREDAYKATRQLLNRAETEQDILTIFREKVLTTLDSVDLQSRPPKIRDLPDPNPRRPKDFIPLEIIGKHFSALLLCTASNLSSRFPLSPLRAIVIPGLRKLGPTAFTLGATTDLYNEALDYIFTVNEDIHGAVDLLREIERMVIEPNLRTLFVLEQILDWTKAIRSGEFGQAVAMVWHTERNRMALKELSGRSQRLAEGFSEQERKTVVESLRDSSKDRRVVPLMRFSIAGDSASNAAHL